MFTGPNYIVVASIGNERINDWDKLILLFYLLTKHWRLNLRPSTIYHQQITSNLHFWQVHLQPKQTYEGTYYGEDTSRAKDPTITGRVTCSDTLEFDIPESLSDYRVLQKGFQDILQNMKNEQEFSTSRCINKNPSSSPYFGLTACFRKAHFSPRTSKPTCWA